MPVLALHYKPPVEHQWLTVEETGSSVTISIGAPLGDSFEKVEENGNFWLSFLKIIQSEGL